MSHVSIMDRSGTAIFSSYAILFISFDLSESHISWPVDKQK